MTVLASTSSITLRMWYFLTLGPIREMGTKIPSFLMSYFHGSSNYTTVIVRVSSLFARKVQEESGKKCYAKRRTIKNMISLWRWFVGHLVIVCFARGRILFSLG